jgi:hypothetical protein
MSHEEVRLAGGNVSHVSRVGETVRKRGAVWDVGVQALLLHLEAVGFHGAPRAMGLDEQGRSVVSYIPGETCHYPMPAFMWADDTLVAAAQLLRAYHDATAGFQAPENAGWQGPIPDGAPDVICHNDVAPYNVLFRDRRPVALVDFDMAAPGPRVWDAAYAAYRFVPLHEPEKDTAAAARELGRRVGLFLRAYGATFTAHDLLDVAIARLAALRAFMYERAAAGDASFARHIADGDADVYQRDAAFLGRRISELVDTAD